MYERFSLRYVLKIIGIGCLVILLFAYVLYQARSFIQGPRIVLSDHHTPLHHEQIVVLEGNAYNIVQITVNGREIHTNAEGKFSHNLVLEKGYSIVTLNAQDRFGRTTEIVREYVYVPHHE